jgi:hypothetical protein
LLEIRRPFLLLLGMHQTQTPKRFGFEFRFGACLLFTPWCTIRKSETWPETIVNKSNEAETRRPQARRNTRLRSRCPKTLCWLLREIRQQQSREASNTTAKKIKTFCSDCDKFYYLSCFNDKHHAMQ